MCARILYSALLVVATTAQHCVCADEPKQSDPVWATVVKLASESEAFYLQISTGSDFELVDAIVEAFPDASDESIKFLPVSNFNLNFHTDAFLLVRIEDDKLFLAPGETFPFSATRELTNRLRSFGLKNAKIVSPDLYLERVPALAPNTPNPFGNDPFRRSFVFRDSAGS